jgi:para-aminobenzoate synthetase component I
MLELHQPEGAFARIESFLRSHGFFRNVSSGHDERCADVYLGYGLSVDLLRADRGTPPEPAALPLAACRVHEGSRPIEPIGEMYIGAWQQTWAPDHYAQAVERVREAIAAGEVYQVNLVQHMSAPFEGDPRAVSAALSVHRPRIPRALQGDGWSIHSASPELFLARRGRRLWTMPIKGTRPQGEAAALRASSKDAAEHMMIVDLERNDLGRICEPGSIRVPSLMEARPMAGVEHLVSTVEGTLRDDVSWAEIMAATFPGGSVTGAPKIAALSHIASLEPVGRGASMGAIGTVWPNGDFELALTIRTFALAAGRIHFWVGGGIVWDSDPRAEVEESWVKARPLLAALESATSASIST